MKLLCCLRQRARLMERCQMPELRKFNHDVFPLNNPGFLSFTMQFYYNTLQDWYCLFYL